jgi:hypothetical protein
MIYRFRFLCFLFSISAAFCYSEIVTPMYKRIAIPSSGFKNISDEYSKCKIVANDTDVLIGESGGRKIFVKDCMSSGSGHGHSIAIGVSKKTAKLPSSGVYLNTSTSGWRTLQQFNGGGLPWLLDVNGDGESELIIWQSFGDGKYHSTASNGLIPFVYVLKGSVFVIDKKSTVILIDQLLKSYDKTISEEKAEAGKSWWRGELFDRLLRRINETKRELLK